MLIAVRVKTQARQDAVLAREGTEWVIALRAAPREGEANAALCALVAEKLGIPPSRVSLKRGARSKHKLLEVPDACTLSDLAL